MKKPPTPKIKSRWQAVTFRIDPELFPLLVKVKSVEGRSVSWYLNEAIRNFAEQRGNGK